MCGRYVSATPPDQIAAYFGAEAPEAVLEPSYNVAPTKDVYAVLSDGTTRHVDAFHWGLVPLWAKDAKIGSKMINARAETLAEKNAYKSAFKKRRCLIPADGFYEWQKNPKDPKGKKQPFYIHRPDGEPFAFAGICTRKEWEDGWLYSCTIITTKPNDVVAQVHDRMPVILPSKDAEAAWLSTGLEADDAIEMCVPLDAGRVQSAPANPMLNKVGKGHEGPEMLVVPNSA